MHCNNASGLNSFPKIAGQDHIRERQSGLFRNSCHKQKVLFEQITRLNGACLKRKAGKYATSCGCRERALRGKGRRAVGFMNQRRIGEAIYLHQVS